MREKRKNAYIEAQIELIRFASCDIITTSGNGDSGDSDGSMDYGSSWDD